MASDTTNDQNPGQAVTPLVDITGIYRNHDGPYSLVITRRVKADLVMAPTRGPLFAREAHTLAVELTSGPGDVNMVHVYSEKEQQFIGAHYTRGSAYAPWREELGKHGYGTAGMGGDSPTGETDVDPGATLFPRKRPSHVRPAAGDAGGEGCDRVGDPEAGDPGLPEVSDAARPKRQAPARTAGDRFPSVRGGSIELDPGNAERWPTSKGAEIIRAWFEQHGRGTVAEVVQAVGPQVQATGVQFPASMISRLKQAGFLRGVTDAPTSTD